MEKPNSERESAPQAHPEAGHEEQGSHTSLDSLVAVEGFEPPTRGL